MSTPSPASPWWEACLQDDGSLEMRLTKQGAALLDLLARGFSYAEATALVKIRDGETGESE